MYRIRKDGKLLKKKFMSYEEARSWVRRKIREKRIWPLVLDNGDRYYSNPSINLYGFSITKQGV